MANPSDFESFFAAFLTAARNGDATFARSTLPPSLPEDHFAFLLQMRKGMVEEVEENQATPEFEMGDDRCIVHYRWKDPENGGEVGLDMPFYRHEGSWVSYDPADPEFA
jgi:hypothetical protein